MKSDGMLFKLNECQICGECEIIGSTNHATVCHGSRMPKQFGLPTKPVAACIAGKWIIGDWGLEEPVGGDLKAIRDYAAMKSKVAIALIPSIKDKPTEIDFDSCRDMFQMKVYQVSMDSCETSISKNGRYNHDPKTVTEESRDNARAFVFSRDFKDICRFIDMDYRVIQQALIAKWAGLERVIEEIEEEEYEDDYVDYDISDLTDALGVLQGTREALAAS